MTNKSMELTRKGFHMDINMTDEDTYSKMQYILRRD